MIQITRQLYSEAHAAKEVLTPAIEALKKIQFGHIFGDTKAGERINVVTCELIAILGSWQDLIDTGNKMHENRPEELIKQASHRLLNDIPRLINKDQKTLEHNIKARQMKIEDMKKKGFGPAEIAHICPEGPETDIDASMGRVSALEAEATAIEAFLADAPRYDVGLLKNTTLAPLIESEEVAA